MWADALRRIRAASTEPRLLLGSWRLSVVLMISACVFYLLLTIYSAAVPSHVVANIAGLTVYWICWSLLLVNTFVCLWNRWRALAWASILFHASLFVVASGVLLSLGSRQEVKLWVAAGEEFTGAADQFIGMRSIAPPKFRVLSIAPEFWRDELLFTKLEAQLDFSGRRWTTRINRPLWLAPASFLRLSGFGYAPRYEILSREGRVLESAFVKLNVFPPGQRDFLLPGSYPYRVYLEIYPDARVSGDRIENATLNLRRPVIVTSVHRGHLAIASAPLRIGQPLELEGVVLRFPEIALWGEFTWVRDLGVPVIFLGFALAIAGLVMKLCTSR